ncbi:GSCFA domain-containing protein [Methylovulum miyakonense]|uniref:GSCFA domain-containing protein n=1 Tax=Methylovulum miyakonense TaxID=645578 RepID=UPI0003672A8D|nr:GSCFA domain-containing protein [Methylovulum miyakonense]
MNPYESLPKEAFWRTAIADVEPTQIQNIWKPKFPLDKKQKIITSGSCFAQHISKALIARGYSWLDGERAPKGLSLTSQKLFNYGVFSFRTGNIYTPALLKQWLNWAIMNEPIPEEVWESSGRFYDPFRPNIEPNGFFSLEEMLASRNDTLSAIRNVFCQSSLFIFTLGLTEAWINGEHGYVYPMCPGTVVGEFDEKKHSFINYRYPQIFRDLHDSFNLIKKVNPSIKLLLTVSPVPLTATAANQHVLVATTYSKSTLRAVADDMVSSSTDIDYFPSYELITSFPFRGMFYQENLRNVTDEGVDFVMKTFFSCLGDQNIINAIPNKPASEGTYPVIKNEDIVCEEEMLSAFSSKG